MFTRQQAQHYTWYSNFLWLVLCLKSSIHMYKTKYTTVICKIKLNEHNKFFAHKIVLAEV